MVPWDPPGVPRVPIFGPNREMFSKLHWPGPLGSGGPSHAFSAMADFGALRGASGVMCFRNAALKECDSEVKRLKRELDKIEEVASDLEAVENDDNLFAGKNKKTS